MAASGTRLGYIGLGLMGGPMAVRLAEAGHPLTVWNRDPAKAAPVLAVGASLAESAAAVARASDIVFTCVSDTAAMKAVVFGPEGIAAGGGAGKLVVDFSSMRPDATRAMAERLMADCDMGWLDAPVSGGVVGAETGQLVVMAGGSEADFARARPFVEALARRVTLMGPVGAGQTTKLVNQLIVGCTVAVVAEATALALESGVDAARIPGALAGGRADSLPLQQWMPKMVAGDETVESHLRTMLKDLDTALDLARSTGTALPLTNLVAELHRLLAGQGLADADGTALFSLYRRDKGAGRP